MVASAEPSTNGAPAQRRAAAQASS